MKTKIKKLVLITFLMSCNKLRDLNLKHIHKGEIPSVMSKYFKEGDSKLYEQINELDFIKFKELYGEDNKNILMLTLSSGLSEVQKEQLFLKLLLLIGKVDGKISTECFSKIFLKNNLFNDLSLTEIKNLSIFDSSKNINVKEVSKIIIENLINYDFLIKSKDLKGKSLIFYAVDSGIESIIELLLQLFDYKLSKYEGLNLLQYTLLKKPVVIEYLKRNEVVRKHLIEELIDEEVLPSPLICAVAVDRSELVKQLIELGQDPDSTDEFKNKAILIAADFNNEEIVNILLASGAKYLTPQKIINRKIKKYSSKAAASLGQLGLDALFRGAGAPLSPNVLGLIGNIKNSHSIERTLCYEKVYEIFIKGKWLNYNAKNSPHHIKNLLKLVKFLSFYLKIDEKEEKDIKIYDKNALKEFIGDTKAKTKEIKEKFPKYMTLITKREKAKDQISTLIKEIERMSTFELGKEDRELLGTIRKLVENEINSHFQKIKKDFYIVSKDKENLKKFHKMLKTAGDKPKLSLSYTKLKDEEVIEIDLPDVTKKLIILLEEIDKFEREIKRLKREINKIKAPKF